MGFFSKFTKGLKKTTESVFDSITKAIINSPIDDELYEDLFEQLLLADVGYETSEFLTEELKVRVRKEKATNGEQVVEILQNLISELLQAEQEMHLETTPSVILIIGVNGVGKTTSIGKLANFYSQQGKRVLLSAADTFRAAAANQLDEWAARANVDIVIKDEGVDPSSVIFDTITKAKNENYDLVICDTAGRLHNKKNLMAELTKIKKVANKACDGADIQTLLVLEATTGQNAIMQAKEFISSTEANGVILTKLDGTAKGGSVISIKRSLGIPVRFIGVGEQIGDLMEFDANEFSKTLVNIPDKSSNENIDQDSLLDNNDESDTNEEI